MSHSAPYESAPPSISTSPSTAGWGPARQAAAQSEGEELRLSFMITWECHQLVPYQQSAGDELHLCPARGAGGEEHVGLPRRRPEVMQAGIELVEA